MSKSDMLDSELIDEIEKTLPEDVPHVFISSVTGFGLTALKDQLWSAISDEANRILPGTITRRPLDVSHRVRQEDEFIFENTAGVDEDDDVSYDETDEFWGEEDLWDEDGSRKQP